MKLLKGEDNHETEDRVFIHPKLFQFIFILNWLWVEVLNLKDSFQISIIVPYDLSTWRHCMKNRLKVL